MNFNQYCMLNLCTDDGLQKIVKYNNYAEEWEDKKGRFGDATSMAEKHFVSIKLYAKHQNKRKYHLDSM